MPDTTDDLFVPPAAEGLPLAALDSATVGADRLDAMARTPNGRNFLAHALVQLARDGWLRTELAAVSSAPADRAALFGAAADRCEERAATLTDGIDDLAAFVAKARMRDAEVWKAAATLLRAMADCHACEAGIEHTVHCPTPETHNWGCGCPGDRLPLYSDRGVDTPGCDCGHNGMGMRWHDGSGCAWFKQLTEEGRRLLAADDGGEEQQPETQAPDCECLSGPKAKRHAPYCPMRKQPGAVSQPGKEG